MSELTPAEKLAIFKDAYYDNGGSVPKAYEAAGFSCKGGTGNAYKYFKNHKEEIQAHVHAKMAEYVPTAIGTIVKIMMSETEKGGIRLKAAADLLDRAGYKPSDRIEVVTEDADSMTTRDIKAEIAKLMKEVDPSLGKLAEFKVIQGGKS